MSAWKRIARRAVVGAVARTAPLTWRWRRPGSLVVLMYHRVLPPEGAEARSEQPGMLVSPATFELHLTELKRRFELVHLNDWLRLAKQGATLPRLACAITFDDGWRDNHDFALPLLVKHGAPATIFLVSDYIGTSYRFWPNRLMSLLRQSFAAPGSVTFPPPLSGLVSPVLAAAAARGSLRPEDADALVQRAKDWDEERIRGLVEAADTSGGAAAAAPDILDREQIQRMRASGLIRFGSHTATHFRLGGPSAPEALRREIVGSREVLEALCGGAVDLFCYPNGETSPEAVDLVRRHYLGAVTTRQGWHQAPGDPYLIRRIGVHEDVSAGREPFLERLSGWL